MDDFEQLEQQAAAEDAAHRPAGHSRLSSRRGSAASWQDDSEVVHAALPPGRRAVQASNAVAKHRAPGVSSVELLIPIATPCMPLT